MLTEVANAISHKLFYSAISVSLSIPDVCSSLEKKDGGQDNFKIAPRYIAWCDRYMKAYLPELTAADIWALRGGIIHNGKTFGHQKSRFSRVVFILPNNGNSFVVTTKLNDEKMPVFNISVDQFCGAFQEATQAWLHENKENPIVLENLENIIRFRPNGYGRHFVGIPVIA